MHTFLRGTVIAFSRRQKNLQSLLIPIIHFASAVELFTNMRTFNSPLLLVLSAGSVLGTAPSNPGSEWKKTQMLDDFNGANGALPSSSNWIVQTGTQYPGGAGKMRHL